MNVLIYLGTASKIETVPIYILINKTLKNKNFSQKINFFEICIDKNVKV